MRLWGLFGGGVKQKGEQELQALEREINAAIAKKQTTPAKQLMDSPPGSYSSSVSLTPPTLPTNTPKPMPSHATPAHANRPPVGARWQNIETWARSDSADAALKMQMQQSASSVGNRWNLPSPGELLTMGTAEKIGQLGQVRSTYDTWPLSCPKPQHL